MDNCHVHVCHYSVEHFIFTYLNSHKKTYVTTLVTFAITADKEKACVSLLQL